MNFLCISNYNNDISWLKDYNNSYVIYDRSDNISHTNAFHFFKSPNIGYNIYDNLRFIIENYDSLPFFTTFCKGNVFPRHISKEKFEKLKDKRYFTCLFDYTLHKEGNWNFFTSDGNYCEINNSWYMQDGKPYKFFSNYNDLIKFCFINPVIPQFITFCPGGNYVVPKTRILKYTKEFYVNLKTFISHSSHAAESHLIERFLYTMWNCEFDVNPNMNKLIEL